MKTVNELEFSLLKQMAQEAEQAAHIHLAKSNCARHMTMLGISRWSSGCTFDGWPLASALSPMSHVSWLETANINFLSWLEAGGFAQPEQEKIIAPSAESTSNRPQMPLATCLLKLKHGNFSAISQVNLPNNPSRQMTDDSGPPVP